MEEEVCPECGNTKLVTDYRRAELICEICSIVVAEKVIREVGVGPHHEDDLGGQSGDRRLLPQHPDSFSRRDSQGRPVNPDDLRKIRTTAKYQNLRSSERAILLFEGRVRELAQQHGIGEAVTRRSIDMYRHVRDRKLFSKPNITELALALLITASRELRYVITWKDLVRGTGVSLKKVTDYHHGIARALGVEYREQSVDNYIMYFAAKIGRMQDGQLLKVAMKNALGNKVPNAAPHCVAAAALFIALHDTGEDWSQHDFCARVNLSEISLREWVSKLGGHAKKESVARVPLNGARVADGP